jgi:hypothetical protein
LRNSFRYASKRDWPELAKDLKPIYTAPSADAALNLFAEFSDKWERRYPAIVRLRTDAWAEFVDLLPFPWVGWGSGVLCRHSGYARPGRGGQSPPRVSSLMAMRASALW